MPINQPFITELEQEAKATRKVLERVPLEKSAWKPHEKSTPLGRLATHVAEIPGWITSTLGADELDFSKFDYKARVAGASSELLQIFEENYSKGMESLKNASDDDFSKNWTMRNGERIYFTLPKVSVIRTFAFNHQYHHRAQLTVYLRLLNVPLPYVYGPTADEPM